MSTKPYDIVVFGATSFVGQILSGYLFEHFGLGGAIKWAAAGRSRSKLEKLRESVGRKAAGLEKSRFLSVFRTNTVATDSALSFERLTRK